MCLLDGFYPANYTNVKWLKDEKPFSGNAVGRTLRSQEQKEGTKGETFTLMSEIEVNAEQLHTSTKYTCQASHKPENYTVVWSSCEDSSLFTPQIRLEKPRLSDLSLTALSKVKASCVVEAAPKSKVSWFLNGNMEKNPIKVTSEERPGRSTLLIVSNLTLSTSEWEKYQNVMCRVKQPCDEKPVEKTVNILESVVKPPTVEIRRPLADVLKGDDAVAVLECSARDLPSGELSVTFQANGRQFDRVQYVDLSKDQHSLTARISIPHQHRNRNVKFTCKVHQSPSKHWTSESTGDIFGGPSVEISVVPRAVKSDPQKVLCIGTGFNPKIKWNSGEIGGEAMMQANGLMKVSSEITVLLKDWNDGKKSTCEVTDLQRVVKKSTSICAAQPAATVAIRLEKPRLVSKTASEEVSASCVVEAAPNSKVSWFLNGNVEKNPTKVTSEERPGRSTLLIVSNLTLSASEWEKYQNVMCRVKQPCDEKPVEKTVNILESVVKPPTVEIRRPLADVLKGDDAVAVLECSARDLPSGELSVTFQANETQLDGVQYMDLSKDQHSLTTRVTIPDKHRNKDSSFSCKVQQSPSKHWKSGSTGRIFDDASMELLVVSRAEKSEPQKLLCTGTGFNPKIQWISKSGEKEGVTSEARMQADGRVKVSSEMKVPLKEWNEGKEFTCQVTDLQRIIQKNISDCAVTAPSAQLAQVYLLGPSFSDMVSADPVPLTCLVIGHSVKDFFITWKVNKTIQSQGITQELHKDHGNGTQSVRSILKLPVATWNSHAVVSCEVNHRCSSKTLDRSINKVTDLRRPTVRVLRPSDSDLSGSHDSTLLCLITGFFPADISVYWELNEKKLDASRFTNSPVAPDSAGRDFSMHSALTLPASQHEHGTFSCIVNHQSSQSPINSTLDNLYASVTNSSPSMEILQGRDELVCLVFDYSPSAININWLLDGRAVEHKHNSTSPAKGPDGKFRVQSQLQVLPSEWAPGSSYTCQVVHITGIFNHTVSKTEIFDETIYYDENLTEATAEDVTADTWNMACAFIILFLLSVVYGCSVTLVRVKID